VAQSSGSAEVAIGAERAIDVAADGVRVLFGIGPAHAVSNRRQRGSRLLQNLAPAVRALRWCHQVHGTEILSTDGPSPADAACIGTCDGLVATEPGVGLIVWTADCVPVLLVGRRVVAAVHAGWRGAARGIIPEVVRRCQHIHGERPENLAAYLGPAISASRYQVGPEVVSALRTQMVDEATWLHGDRVDLRSFLTSQLRQGAVEHITIVGGCTASDARMASYRRDGTAAGRQWSLVYRPCNSLRELQ
jgi:YfiH family protein